MRTKISPAVCRSAGRADGGYGSGHGGGIYCLRNTSLLSSRRGWRFGMPLRAGCCVPSNRLPQPVTGGKLFLSVQGRPPNDGSRCHGVRQALVCAPPAGKGRRASTVGVGNDADRGRAPSPSDVRCLLPICIVRSRRAAQGGEAAYKRAALFALVKMPER